ncbi:MAG: hypothetical protein EHM64_08360 [Ignavibacteriae bacterium]|nr:MAG: hypothetical protein EHM64_08360 [Ignavibacteriota bacterium]
MKKGYSNIQELLKNELLRDEDETTRVLIEKLGGVRKRGYFTKNEFLKMCRWKSPRPLRHYKSNSEDQIRIISKNVLSTKFEIRRISLLTSLKGVSIPVASAILTLTDPARYGVIDIRVWQLLHHYGSVKTNPKGRKFSASEWYTYLMKIRYYAKKLSATTRQVERTLFTHHKKIQEGTLYG